MSPRSVVRFLAESIGRECRVATVNKTTIRQRESNVAERSKATNKTGSPIVSMNPVDQETTRLNNGFLSTFQRKRRHLFRVDLKIERVVSLPYANGKFFFKIRLLNGGHHVYTCVK